MFDERFVGGLNDAFAYLPVLFATNLVGEDVCQSVLYSVDGVGGSLH